MPRWIIMWVMIISLASCGESCNSNKTNTNTNNVDPNKAGNKAAMNVNTEGQEYFVIDNRSKAEWDEGHIEGAIRIEHDDIVEKITKYCQDKNQKIYVHCKSGGRSGKARQKLEDAGYTNVEDLKTLENAKKHLATIKDEKSTD